MSAQDRAVKKLATEIARIRAEVKSWRGAQADFTSIENGGNFTFKDGDGNVTAIMGGQDDGSNTIRHVDGPTPPIPSGLSAHVDGPIVQVSWDGTFEDADTATYDWSHLEVIVVGPSNEQLTATINDVTGATANLAATASGEWTVVARSVSRAEKRSLDGDAGTVEVKLVDIDGAIEAVQDSANGKNKVTYSEHAPTESDPGIFDDTWFVGQVGRPNDVVEATNTLPNPSFENGLTGYIQNTSLSINTTTTDNPYVGTQAARVEARPAATAFTYIGTDLIPFSAGRWIGTSVRARADTPGVYARTRILFYTASGSTISQVYVSDIHALTGEWSQISGALLAPAGTAQVRTYLYLYSDASGTKPSAGQALVTDGWVVDDAGSEAEALARVVTYFDGDTPSGESDNESHYRWTGTPHASTSEKYLPALTIGDSDSWNITEQYRHDGSGWVKVELSHKVFSSVDLGKATVGELDGIRIMGQTVRGEQLSGDAIDGKVITGATYRTSGGNGSWSDAGLFIAQPDGTSMVRFPTDGSPLSLTASDVQIERASIDKLDVESGSIRSGGTFDLASGVTAPPSPPEAVSAWDMTVNLPRPPEQRMDWNGFAAWGDKWVRGVNVLGTGEGDRLEVYNADGTLNKTIPILIDPRHDLTVIGDICYVFGKDHVVTANDVYCFAYNLTTGARVARWQFLTNAPTQQIGVTSVGSDLLTAQVSADGDTLIVTRRDASTGLVIESSPTGDAVWDLNYTNDVQGIHWDGTDLYVTHRDSTRVYTYSGSGYTRKAGSSNGTQWAGWANPNRNAGGMVFVGGVPVVVSGALYTGSTATVDAVSEVCYTWWDGTHESTPSPVATVESKPRETVTVSLPIRAGLQKRLYSRSVGGGNWARSVIPENVSVFPRPTGFANYSPPTTNTFPNADPAVFRSTNGNVVVRGDGSGKWGPLTFNADGTMTSTQIPAWVPITSFGSGFGPQTFGYAPAYRVWPDGKVEWRGIVAGSMAAGPSGDYAILTIPAEARPSQPVDMISATGAGGGAHGMVRIEFTNSINPDKLMVLVRQANITWVSLDGHYYYKD